jgi:hypothetical protein
MVQRGTKLCYVDRLADDDFVLTLREYLHGECRPAIHTVLDSFVSVLEFSYGDGEIV